MTAAPAPRVLVVGWGGMGRLYGDALQKADALAGVLTRTEPTAARARAAGARATTSLDEAIASFQPDALAVFTTTDWHARYARIGIGRGLPTLVIKPACTRPEVARSLDEAARAADVPVMVAHEGVLQPAFAALEQAIAEGRIGRVREIQWVKEGEETLSGGREREPEGDADAIGRNLAFVYATTMHELYAANRLAGRAAPSSAEVGEAYSSTSRLSLDARLEYAGGIVTRLRYRTGPGVPFRRGLHVVGEQGGLLWLMQPGKTTLQLRTPQGPRDLPFHGFGGSNPATPVVSVFLAVARREIPPPEGLVDGAHALEAARLVTAAAARRLGMDVDLDALAGGADHGEPPAPDNN